MIRAIIFDFAGVVMEEGYWNWLAKYVLDLPARRDLFMDLSHKIDRNLISHDAFLGILAKESGMTSDVVFSTLDREFVIRPHMVDLIRDLKKHYKVGLLSNFPKDWLPKILASHDLSYLFDSLTISAELGSDIAKPDSAIYLDALGKLGVLPQEAVFVDDREVNVSGAEAVGMQGIFFSSYEDFLATLSARGIIK